MSDFKLKRFNLDFLCFDLRLLQSKVKKTDFQRINYTFLNEIYKNVKSV